MHLIVLAAGRHYTPRVRRKQTEERSREWEPAAQSRLDKVPFFIRKRVKQQIEEYVARQGRLVVTDQDVTEARRRLVGGEPDSPASSASATPLPPGEVHTSAGVLSAAELMRIEEVVEKGVALEGLKTRYHEVKVCGGAAGCPLSLIEDARMARDLAAVIAAAGLDEYMARQIAGPALAHHRFRVVVSGCPNGCSQPQIADFGVIGQAVPAWAEGLCTGCGQCEETCDEAAISLAAAGPLFDTSRCLRCGDCIRVCPTGAIYQARSGFRVLVGGKLGRHPRLASTVMDLASAEEVVAALRAVLQVYMEQAVRGERFAGLVERLGTERVSSLLQQKAVGQG